MTLFARHTRQVSTKALLVVAALVVLGPALVAVSGFGRASHRLGARLATLSPLSTLPIVSDFDGDHKLEQAELSSRGPLKTIYVTLGRSAWQSWSFDPGVAEKGRLVSGDFDSDGDADLVWLSQSYPKKSVVWYGDGHGNFSIATNPQRELHRLRAMLSGKSQSAVTDHSIDHGLLAVLLMGFGIALSHNGFQFADPASRGARVHPAPPVSTPALGIVRKRGPPSGRS